MKRALVSVNGSIEKGSKGALVRVNGGIEKGQWNVNGRWSGSMGVLKRVNGMSMGVGQGQLGIEQWGLNGGIENNEEGIGQGQCGIEKGPRGALVRVNGGIEKGQWNVNGRLSGSMGVLKRVNGMSMGVGQGQWRY